MLSRNDMFWIHACWATYATEPCTQTQWHVLNPRLLGNVHHRVLHTDTVTWSESTPAGQRMPPSPAHRHSHPQPITVPTRDSESMWGKGSPYSITEHRVPELIQILGSQPAGDVSHKPDITGCHYFPPGLQLPQRPFCTWVQHANHSATEPPSLCSKLFMQFATHSPLSVTCGAAWWWVDWPIAIKKQISNSTRSDQPFQKLIYAICYSQLSITFVVFDMFVCISCMCLRVHVDFIQPLAARNNKINVVLMSNITSAIQLQLPCCWKVSNEMCFIQVKKFLEQAL